MIIAIPRAHTEEDCHFSATLLRPPSVKDGRGENSGPVRTGASSRTHPRRVLMTHARTHARTPAPRRVVVHPFSAAWLVSRATTSPLSRANGAAPRRAGTLLSPSGPAGRYTHLRSHAGIDCHSRAPRFALFRGRNVLVSFLAADCHELLPRGEEGGDARRLVPRDSATGSCPAKRSHLDALISDRLIKRKLWQRGVACCMRASRRRYASKFAKGRAERFPTKSRLTQRAALFSRTFHFGHASRERRP